MQSALQISGWVRSGSLQACLAEQPVLIDKSQHCSCRNNFVSREKGMESPGKMSASGSVWSSEDHRQETAWTKLLINASATAFVHEGITY